MQIILGTGKRFAVKLTAAALCVGMLLGLFRVPALAGTAEAAIAEDPYRLVDIHCSQSAKDALGRDQLQALVDLIVSSIEPQAVNLLIECFPCFQEAAASGELGREIGLYIYYSIGDQDGIPEHEDVAPGAYAYVDGSPGFEADESVYKYMICMDAKTFSTLDSEDNAVLNMDGQTRVQVDTTFCHELFHAFMGDYNRVGMSGYTDFDSFMRITEEEITPEEEAKLFEATLFPSWFIEGLAGCVGNIYPADLNLFREYRYDVDARQYVDTCTPDQLRRMYVYWDQYPNRGCMRYDLEAISDDGSAEEVAAVYVSGYLACLYLAELGCRAQKGVGAVTFDQNGGVASISSEGLREGLSMILSRLHRGDTLDEVIRDISGGAYKSTRDFTARFIKGNYNEKMGDCDGDAESLAFCVGYLNYMNRLDALDPDTHPAGSVLLDDFASTQPTPLEKDAPAASDFYRIIDSNAYPTDQVLAAHSMDTTAPVPGSTASVCTECGYVLVELDR